MATYRKRGSTWRAEVAKSGTRLSATFETKAAAVAWATAKEAELGRRGPLLLPANNSTFADALRRYELDIGRSRRAKPRI